MTLKSTLVLLCAVFLPSVLANVREIKKKNEEISKIESEIDQMHEALVQLPSKYKKRVEKLDLFKKGVSPAIKKEWEIIKDMTKYFVYSEMNYRSFNGQKEELRTLNLKRILSLKWAGQLIADMKSKKANIDNTKCQKLELEMAEVELNRTLEERNKLRSTHKETTKFWKKIQKEMVDTVQEAGDVLKIASKQVNLLQKRKKENEKTLRAVEDEIKELRLKRSKDNPLLATELNTLEQLIGHWSCYIFIITSQLNLILK